MGLQLCMVAVRTNLFATLSLRVGSYVRADVIKGGRGMMGIDCFFFTRHKYFGDIECLFGSFANSYAQLQIFMKIQ